MLLFVRVGVWAGAWPWVQAQRSNMVCGMFK